MNHTPSATRPISRWTRGFAVALAALGTAAAVSAAPTYLVDATTDGLPPDPSFTNVAFSLSYEDFNLDQLFSLNELLAFTGFIDAMGNYFDQLLAVPDANGVLRSDNRDVWEFGDGNGNLAAIRFAAGSFTPFTQSAVDIPLPGSPGLAALGLVALAGARRRRRSPP